MKNIIAVAALACATVASASTNSGEVYSNATDAVEWVVPRTVMTQLVIASERL